MSSAILYLAIVAIWACVLIPRWLRRDSAAGVAAAPHGTGSRAPPVDAGHAEHADPAPPGRSTTTRRRTRRQAARGAGRRSRRARRRHGGACSPPAAACC